MLKLVIIIKTIKWLRLITTHKIN